MEYNLHKGIKINKFKGKDMKKVLFFFLLLTFSTLILAEIIIDEDFSTWLPTGWTTYSSSGQINWQQGSGSSAGGTSPEAEFDWSPSTIAVQRLISLPVNTVGATSLDLEFIHTNNDFSGGYTIRLETTSDGNNWNIVTTFPSSSFNAVQEQITIMNPDVGSPTFQVAWVFDGDSWDINYWYVDDVILSGTLITYDNDLAAIGIEGASVVNAGNTENYEITVKNVGYNTQDSYTVKLKKQSGEVLSSIDITQPIAYEEIGVHTLVWNIPADEPPGTILIYGEVELTDDENPLNDITSYLEVEVFPQGVMEVSVGDGTELNTRIPVSFEHKNSLTECLFFTEEMGGITGMITALTYYNNFVNTLMNKPTAIWMGETTQTNLENGWIPATQLTQVFNGNVHYFSGQNDVTIELTTPYMYEGGNLVVMVHRPMDTQNYGNMDRFYHDETPEHIDRTRYERDDTIIFDPYDPPELSYTFEKFANITFTFFQGATGNVEGYVFDDMGSPLEGAEILIEENQMITYSNDMGYYYFGNVLTGTYSFTASAFGYFPQTVVDDIIENEIIQIDFNLIPLGVVSVSGHVEGSDHPGIGLENAFVNLTGFANYQAYTNSDGNFTIDGVYTNCNYNLEISFEGYENYSNEVQVGGVNLDIGTVVLNELTAPPGNVQAIQNELGTEVELTWNSPGQGGYEFRYDDGDVDFQIGYSDTPANAVFGAVHPHVAIVQEVKWFLTSTSGTHDHVKVLIFGLDQDGLPDSEQLLHESVLLTNNDDEWNSYILSDQIEAPDGFLIGVCTPNLYTSIGLDDGVEEPWVFQFGTQMSVSNWTNFSEEWTDIGTVSPQFQKNMMIRAYGIDMGHTLCENAGKRISERSGSSSDSVELRSSREFESYNVYRFPESYYNFPEYWDLIATSVTDTFHTDTSWDALPNGVYQFAITSVHTNNVESIPAFSDIVEKTLAGIEPEELEIIKTRLIGNYPNPFNPAVAGAGRSPKTTISFNISRKDAKHAKVDIYNLKGQKVKTLECNNHVIAEATESLHHVTWDGKDENNKTLSSGIYFYRLVTDRYSETKKMLLLR